MIGNRWRLVANCTPCFVTINRPLEFGGRIPGAPGVRTRSGKTVPISSRQSRISPLLTAPDRCEHGAVVRAFAAADTLLVVHSRSIEPLLRDGSDRAQRQCWTGVILWAKLLADDDHSSLLGPRLCSDVDAGPTAVAGGRHCAQGVGRSATRVHCESHGNALAAQTS